MGEIADEYIERQIWREPPSPSEEIRKFVQKEFKKVKMNRDYYKVLIVSQSGKGKTYSFRNMDENKTGFINAENKPLPFIKNFAFHARPKAFAGVMAALDDYAKNPDIDVIVLDSLSAAFEMLAEEARKNYSGWDIWNHYNKKIGEFLKKVKDIEKEVFITAHYELLNIEGETERRVKAKGKEWEGVIEKEFTIVLYAKDKYKGETPEYFFKLAAEGSSAKCPPGIFGEGILQIENDSKKVLDKIQEFTGVKQKSK